MRRSVALGAALLLWSICGCGGAGEPTERDIWYTQSLRPGRVPPETAGERELLARMEEVPVGEPVALGSQIFVVDAPYAAASGRLCRSVEIRSSPSAESGEVKLACEENSGWAFVPDVFADERAAAEARP